MFSQESSPAGSSPFSNNANSPRLFWQGRDQTSPARENRNPHELHPSPHPGKRSSIENLKKASRVKNSGMFALEQTNHYDPSRPSILDGRPLSTSQASAISGSDAVRKENEPPRLSPAKPKTEATQLDEDVYADAGASLSPGKLNGSPKKSSLSKKTGSQFRHSDFDLSPGIWEDEEDQEKRLPEGKSLHRYAKSVTFDQAPPQVNEYEMTTPDPSSVASGSREGSYDSVEDDEELGYERGSSIDHDDSFDASLEDTDKTPVVMPEDWRFMSPDLANTELAQHEEDVFDDEYGSPAPTADPGPTPYRLHQTSVNSVDSNGQPRPLPPLPAGLAPPAKPAAHRDSLSGTLERMSGQRQLPSPPFVAGVSKSDIRRMSGGNFSMDDRLRLMMAEQESQKNAVDASQRERRMRRADGKSQSPVRDSSHESEIAEPGQPGPEVDDSNAPHISRESIMRHMRSNQDLQDRAGSEESEARSLPSVYDPDVPIPSREDPTQKFHDFSIVKQEEPEDNELSSIPDYYANHSDLESDADDDLTSQYSQPSMPNIPTVSEDGQETPRANSPVRESEKKTVTSERMSLPDFMDFGQESSFDLGLQTYMTPPTEPQPEKRPTPPPKNDMKFLPDLAALRTSIQRPYTPQEQLEPPVPTWESEEPGTPDSVIRHPTKASSTPEITESQATVEAPGNKLEVRPSLTASEADSLQHDVDISPQEQLSVREQSSESAPPVEEESAPARAHRAVEPEKKRVSSLVQLQIPHDRVDEGLSFGLEKEFDRVVEAQKVEFERSLQHLYYPFNGRFPSSELPDSKDSTMRNPTLDVPTLLRPRGAPPLPEEDHFPHVESFANRFPRRQRGYLMRQNTKVVVASERVSQDEARPALPPSRDGGLASLAEANEVVPSSRKTSQPTWTAEPWNSKKRRKSIRVGGETSPQKRKQEVVPPLPGQASAVQEGLGPVAEDELAEDEADDFEDGAERGRLFVKVIGVKDLQLPFPRGKSDLEAEPDRSNMYLDERTSFALTLDNGMHCVTTAWLDLAKDAPIGQEFELVVLNDLEFQLTLQMKLEEPKQQRPISPSKPPSSPKKQGAFSRLFGSPRKRTEEAKIQELKRPVTPPSFYELVQSLVAKDGSFARAYINLSEHEKQAYGRPHSVDIKCFNEWAMEEVNVGSSRSKKSVTQLQRRPPYEIGKLELLLLYIPKPKGAKDEDMPKSMNSAVRAMREAEERSQQTVKTQEFEGHLSQQGGDCPVS